MSHEHTIDDVFFLRRGRLRRIGGLLAAALLLLLLAPAASLAGDAAGPAGKKPDIGDFVWYDMDGDGIQDAGEGGLAGVTVNLLDGLGDLVRTTTTNATGQYYFMDVEPGDYGLQFVSPEGYAFTRQYAGSDPARDSDADPGGYTVIVTLVNEQQDYTWDAGLLILSSISGALFYDDNRSGARDAAEWGIPGVTVALYDDDGGSCNRLRATQVTDASGAYLFAGLFPGHHCVVVPETPAGNPLLVDMDRTAGANPHEVTLTEDQAYAAAQFGYAGRGEVRGQSFYDWNQNGLREAGEPGMAGVGVCLYADANLDGQRDAGTPLACAVTDDLGAFAFTRLLPGGYLVVETDSAGMTSFSPNELSVSLVIAQGEGQVLNNFFANLASVQLGDFVWVDVDSDGAQDPSEQIGLTGVLLRLTGVNVRGEVVDTNLQTSNGSYQALGLLPGTYTVTAPVVFSGYKLTSAPALTTRLSVTRTEDLTLDFGYAYPTGLSVQDFAAVSGRAGVALTWRTLYEEANTGFSVWRADGPAGPWQQISSEPIASLGAGGGEYRFADTTAAPGRTYWYRLRAAPSGAIFGPLTVRTSSFIFLPQLGW